MQNQDISLAFVSWGLWEENFHICDCHQIWTCHFQMSWSRIQFIGVSLLLRNNQENFSASLHIFPSSKQFGLLMTSRHTISLSLVRQGLFPGSSNRWLADSSTKIKSYCGGRGAIKLEMQLSEAEVGNLLLKVFEPECDEYHGYEAHPIQRGLRFDSHRLTQWLNWDITQRYMVGRITIKWILSDIQSSGLTKARILSCIYSLWTVTTWYRTWGLKMHDTRNKGITNNSL